MWLSIERLVSLLRACPFRFYFPYGSFSILLQCTSFTMYIWSLNLPQGHSFTHRVSSEIQTLTYKALCDLVPKLPLQPFSYFSALFFLCSNHLGFLNVLWTCRTYTFFRTFVIAVKFAWDNFPSDNHRACWDTAFGFLPNQQHHPT